MIARKLACALTALVLLGLGRDARAQELLLGGSGSGSSGVEGGGGHTMALQRARTRLRLGVDMRNSEEPKDVLGIGVLLEVEPHTAVGADIRYYRFVDTHFLVDIGAMGIVFPASLFGGTAGLEYRHPIGAKTAFFAGPEVNVFAFGSDLPGGTIIWQGLLQLGLHVDL
jgi:hypothetical protein